MDTKLLAFINKYLGREGTGDTAGNKGQCVGLIEAWLDSWALPHIWGNAAELLNQADPAVYTTTPNGPLNFPPPGAIVVWGPSWGAGYGHCAVAVAATSMQLVCFEQNDPEGAAPLVATHSYGGVIGWIVPKAWPAK